MKKINVGLLGFIIVFLFTINFQVSKDFKLNELSLLELKSIALADGEDDPGRNQECKEDACSITFLYVTYYGHYKHCGYGEGICITADCAEGCDAL